MKKNLIAALAILALATPGFKAAAASDEVKTGWNLGPLPAVSYSSDKGFQYGVCCDFYYFGDGSTYPEYKHKFATEISHFTKGDTRAHIFYDSKYLIKGIRVSGAITYVNSPLLPFYGFNGLEQYNKDFDLNKELTIPVANYNYSRDMLRVLADFQGEIPAVPNLRWAAGTSFWHFAIKDIDTDKYGYNTTTSLYNRYKVAGLIEDGDANGGDRLEFKAGLTYSSRDMEAAPNRGIWAELYLNGSPDIFGDGYNYLKLCAHFRNYIPIIDDNGLTFAYHLAYQGTIAGEAPFYIQSNITTLYLKQVLSEGLGSTNSLRGTLYNRLIGNDYAWANFELRIKLFQFKLFNQNFYLATNPFFDMGTVLSPYRAEQMATYLTLLGQDGHAWTVEDVTKEARSLHCSAGAGLKVVMNKNFIICFEAAKAFNPNDNPGLGINIGLNYIF